MLEGNGIAWAKFALTKIGFDATTEEVNRWIPNLRVESGTGIITKDLVPIMEEDVSAAREELRAAEPGKTHNSKSDQFLARATELLLSSVGRSALRIAMQNISRETLLDVLDFRAEERGKLSKPPHSDDA